MELDDVAQIAVGARGELGPLWLLGPLAVASAVVDSRFVTTLVSIVVMLDILVSINLEPNPPEHYDPAGLDEFAFVLNIIATSIFTIEMFLRIHAMKFKGYIRLTRI